MSEALINIFFKKKLCKISNTRCLTREGIELTSGRKRTKHQFVLMARRRSCSVWARRKQKRKEKEEKILLIWKPPIQNYVQYFPPRQWVSKLAYSSANLISQLQGLLAKLLLFIGILPWPGCDKIWNMCLVEASCHGEGAIAPVPLSSPQLLRPALPPLATSTHDGLEQGDDSPS